MGLDIVDGVEHDHSRKDRDLVGGLFSMTDISSKYLDNYRFFSHTALTLIEYILACDYLPT